jgi:hypothetical protein
MTDNKHPQRGGSQALTNRAPEIAALIGQSGPLGAPESSYLGAD